MAGMELMGTFFIWFFQNPQCSSASGPSFHFFSSPSGEVRRGLTTTSLVAAVQAFVTGAAAHHDVAAYITGRRITLHSF